MQVDQLDNVFYDFNELNNSLDAFVYFCCKRYKAKFDTLYSDFKKKYEKFCNSNNFSAIDFSVESLKSDFGFSFAEKKQLMLVPAAKNHSFMLNKQFVTKFATSDRLKIRDKFLITSNRMAHNVLNVLIVIFYYLLVDLFFLGSYFTETYLQILPDAYSYISLLNFANIGSETLLIFSRYFSLVIVVTLFERYFNNKKDIFCSSLLSYAINITIWLYVYFVFFWRSYLFAAYGVLIVEFFFDLSRMRIKYDAVKILFLVTLIIFVIYLIRSRYLKKKIKELCFSDQRRALLREFKNLEVDVGYKKLRDGVNESSSQSTQMKQYELLNILEHMLEKKTKLGANFKPLFYDCCVKLNINLPLSLYDLLFIIVEERPKKTVSKYLDFMFRANMRSLRFKNQTEFAHFSAVIKRHKKILGRNQHKLFLFGKRKTEVRFERLHREVNS